MKTHYKFADGKTVSRNGGQIVAVVFSFVCLIAVLAGCSKEVSVAPVVFTPKLVVNAHISPDSHFEVFVSVNGTPEDPLATGAPSDTEVIISDTEAGEEIHLYREDTSFVAHHHRPVPGRGYMLNVSAPGYESVTAYTIVPEVMGEMISNVKAFELKPSESTPQKNNLSYELDVNLANLSIKDNYVHVMFRQHTSLNTGSINNPQIEKQSFSIEPEFPEESGFIRHLETGVLADLGRLGNPQSLHFSFNNYTIDEFEEVEFVEVQLRIVNKEYYDYFVSLRRQLINRNDPFAEPFQVYSNIENGLGYFGAFTTVTDSVFLRN